VEGGERVFFTPNVVSVEKDPRPIQEILADTMKLFHVDDFVKLRKSFFYSIAPKVKVLGTFGA
jgi:hypothetical protein